MTFLQKTIPSPGQNIGFPLKVSKLLPKKPKSNRTSLEELSKMSNRTHSQDSASDKESDFEKIWKEMDEIEPLTPLPPSELEDSYQAYREAALSDSYMFGEYNGYEAYKEG